MKDLKDKRRKKILELITERKIETQEELTERLKNSGFDATQGTVSRDIRDMGLVKTKTGDGRFVYAPKDEKKAERAEKMSQMLSAGVVSIEPSGNIIVIKTMAGAAGAVAASVDALDGTGILGTIAGDDTIFCVIRGDTEKAVKKLRLAVSKQNQQLEGYV